MRRVFFAINKQSGRYYEKLTDLIINLMQENIVGSGKCVHLLGNKLQNKMGIKMGIKWVLKRFN